ncbi:MAG: transporter substrate-binding domain-containing protein [Oscillospiraceae bacterium]|jgi:polar amino acid transport system substrate-binding protein|nr:transporter substrate-binding domain-containing protein [Oscillospiraceae bacterium]
MKIVKRYAVLATALAMLLTVCSCAKKNENNAGNSGKKTLTMATSADFPPYEFYGDGKIVGIDAEIAAAIADKLGMELVIEDMDFDSIIVSIETGKYDMGMAGLTATDERMQQVSFTASYATGIQVIVVPQDSPIASVDDLFEEHAFYKIGVQMSTTGDIYASEDLENEGLAYVDRYLKGADAIMALNTGKVDCVIIDNEPAKVFVSQNPGLKILDTEYAVEQYAIAVNKDKTELLEKIDGALRSLIVNGTARAIVDKYVKAY